MDSYGGFQHRLGAFALDYWIMSETRQTLYDGLAGTFVTHRP